MRQPFLAFSIFCGSILFIAVASILPKIANRPIESTANPNPENCATIPPEPWDVMSDLSPTSNFRWSATSTSILEPRFVNTLVTDPTYKWEVRVPGETWITIATASNADYVPWPFTAPANPKWTSQIDMGNIQIQPISWDGNEFTPGIMGEIRRRGNCFQIALMTYDLLDSKVDKSGEMPYVYPIAPYRYQFLWFTSDWTSIPLVLQDFQRAQINSTQGSLATSAPVSNP
jgi:hypothetical protein